MPGQGAFTHRQHQAEGQRGPLLLPGKHAMDVVLPGWVTSRLATPDLCQRCSGMPEEARLTFALHGDHPTSRPIHPDSGCPARLDESQTWYSRCSSKAPWQPQPGSSWKDNLWGGGGGLHDARSSARQAYSHLHHCPDLQHACVRSKCDLSPPPACESSPRSS